VNLKLYFAFFGAEIQLLSMIDDRYQ